GTGVRGGHRHGRHVDIGAVVVAFAVHGRGRLGRRGVVRRRGDDREADAPDLGDVARLVQGPVAQRVVADLVDHDRRRVRVPGVVVADRVLDAFDARPLVRGRQHDARRTHVLPLGVPRAGDLGRRLGRRGVFAAALGYHQDALHLAVAGDRAVVDVAARGQGDLGGVLAAVAVPRVRKDVHLDVAVGLEVQREALQG